MIRILILLLFCLELSSPIYAEASSRLNAQDFSLLLPLPSQLSDESLFKPNTQALEGELLPRDVLEDLIRDKIPHDLKEAYRHTRAVGVQIQPCFASSGLSTYELCRPQIHLLWQPLKEQESSSGIKEIAAFNTAIHVYYEIPVDEFKTLLRGLKQIKNSQQKKQTLKPLFWNDLKEILLAFIGPQRIHRVSIEYLDPQSSLWKTRELELISGKPVKFDIQKQILTPSFHSFGYWNGKPFSSEKDIQQNSDNADLLDEIEV